MTQVISAFGTVEQAVEAATTYRSNGQVETLTDGEGNRTTYAYDGHDRLARTFYPSPTTDGMSSTTDYEEFGYDPDGNVTSRKTRHGNVLPYTYDALNRLTYYDSPNYMINEVDRAYGYDQLGRVTSIGEQYPATFSYDALGRRLTEADDMGTRSSEYDIAGRRTRLTYPDGFFVTYDYNTTGEMIAVKESGATLLASYSYDDLGRRTKLSRGNGTHTHYGYDAVSRLVHLGQELSPAHNVALTFSYNPAGQIVSTTRNNDLYSYDAVANGSRTDSHNGLNQVTASGSEPVSHDANGNTTVIGNRGFAYTAENWLGIGGGRYFQSDGQGRTRIIHTPDWSSHRVLNYDGFGRRLTETGRWGRSLRPMTRAGGGPRRPMPMGRRSAMRATGRAGWTAAPGGGVRVHFLSMEGAQDLGGGSREGAMRIGLVIGAAALALGASPAGAQDWRAVPSYGDDIGFVDADSVRRRGERISFRGRFLRAENGSRHDPGYDRYDVRVSGTCAAGPNQDVAVRAERSFFRRGRRVAEPGETGEDARFEAAWMTDQLCRGVIGYRRFADPAAAMAEYRGHGSSERLASFVSDEVVLTGTVIQGFEMNGVALCGSEAGCVDDAPSEFCWLEGNINVPAPAGAPDWVGGGPRRDSADVRFKGRIVRSRTGRGFGHVSAFGCQVEQTGPAEFITISQRRPARAERSQAGGTRQAIAAHAALAALVSPAAPVTVVDGAKRFTIDELQPGEMRNNGSGACATLLRRGGTYLEGSPPVPIWSTDGAAWEGGTGVGVTTSAYRDELSFTLGTFAQAAQVAALMERLRRVRIVSVDQAGRQVVLRLQGGAREVLRFADAAEAVTAAGIAAALKGVEIAKVHSYDNRISALPVRRYSFEFADAATAERAAAAMAVLQAACAER